jgi:hypothetical protein
MTICIEISLVLGNSVRYCISISSALSEGVAEAGLFTSRTACPEISITIMKSMEEYYARYFR